MMIFDFDQNSVLSNWYIVNDTVMGGVSSSSFEMTPDGHALFHGDVSTANNGGFASVRYEAGKVATADAKQIKLRIKGDGKTYQFRIKAHTYDRHSYVANFNTSGEWETIKIDLNQLEPQFRGRKLRMPHFDSAHFEELGILIGNKKNQSFQLLIDNIELK